MNCGFKQMIQPGKCPDCPFGNDAVEEHTCPYEVDINDNLIFECTCCLACQDRCSDNI